MQSIELQVRNPSGLHARPAAIFVKAAAGFRSRIRVTNLDREGATDVDAKSILAVLGLGVGKGHRIRLTADGEDEAAVLEALRGLVDAGLGEPLED